MEEYHQYKASKRATQGQLDVFRRVTCIFSQEKFEKNVTHFLMDNHLALRTVENLAFRQMFDDLKIKHGNQSLEHMTRYKVANRVSDLHDQKLNEIREAVMDAKYVCTTADMWTGSNRRFLGVTAHWLDEKTVTRKSAALACRRFSGTHSFENIAALLADIHGSFGLTSEKLVATVTDNRSNFVKAFQKFGVDMECFTVYSEPEAINELSDHNADAASTSASPSKNEEVHFSDESSFEFEDDVTIHSRDSDEALTINEHVLRQLPYHIRCASHTLNLIASTDTINALEACHLVKIAHNDVLETSKSLWMCLNSPKKRQKLRQLLRCSLKRPIPTRCNSLYDCLKQIHSLKELITSYDVECIVHTRTPFREKDFSYIEEYLTWCRPVATAIDILQGDINCHYGYLLPTLLRIKRKWSSLLNNNDKLRISKNLVQILQYELERRFYNYFNVEGIGEFVAVAAFSHPRFKMTWMSALSDDAQTKVTRLVQNITRLQRNEETPLTHTVDEDDFFDFDNDQ